MKTLLNILGLPLKNKPSSGFSAVSLFPVSSSTLLPISSYCRLKSFTALADLNSSNISAVSYSILVYWFLLCFSTNTFISYLKALSIFEIDRY